MSWLIALFWGGFVGLDATSVPQAMYSRPLVASTVVGLLFGRPAEGAILGLLLELFALPVLPFGGSAYPEAGTAAVAASTAYLTATPMRDDTLMLVAVVLGLLVSHVAGWTVRLLRIRNARIGPRVAVGDGVDPRRLERAHRAALALDYLRAAAATGAAAAVALLALTVLEGMEWGLDVPPLDLALIAAAAVTGAGLWIFGSRVQRLGAFVLGGAVGAVLVVLV